MLSQNLGKFYKVVLKILSGNEMMTDGHNDRRNDGMIHYSVMMSVCRCPFSLGIYICFHLNDGMTDYPNLI